MVLMYMETDGTNMYDNVDEGIEFDQNDAYER